jgi:hypothetical protein
LRRVIPVESHLELNVAGDRHAARADALDAQRLVAEPEVALPAAPLAWPCIAQEPPRRPLRRHAQLELPEREEAVQREAAVPVDGDALFVERHDRIEDRSGRVDHAPRDLDRTGRVGQVDERRAPRDDGRARELDRRDRGVAVELRNDIVARPQPRERERPRAAEDRDRGRLRVAGSR